MERMSEERKEQLRKLKKRSKLHTHLFDVSIFALGGLLLFFGVTCIAVSGFTEQQHLDIAAKAQQGSYHAMLAVALRAIDAAGLNIWVIGLLSLSLAAVIAMWHSLSSSDRSCDASRLPEVLAEKAGQMANEKPELRGYLIPLAEKSLEEDNETYLLSAFDKIRRFEKYSKEAERLSMDMDYLTHEMSRYESELDLLRRQMGI